MTEVGLFEVEDANGNRQQLQSALRPVTLIVNVASECGFTVENYTQLQELYNELAPRGFQILAFPCNQFEAQEPKSAQDIVCEMGAKFGATFPIYGKIDVNGANTHPLYAYLKQTLGGVPCPVEHELYQFLLGEKVDLANDEIKWNFEKFLIVNGRPIKRFEPTTSPNTIKSEIEAALQSAGL
eukprot:c48583_g1_i1.p1 GENE.c48583_g1_i1~~c48583_g1_i1.p1  ORF type:complete len:190 (+),score=56.28 c48583_g1_i1:23-571(+)